MKASWNGQVYKSEGSYSLQFETDSYYLYRFVEKACQDAMDVVDLYNKWKRGDIPMSREAARVLERCQSEVMPDGCDGR